jgi:hypothetical protein
MAAKTKEPLWSPPEHIVRELLDAASERPAEDVIYHAETVKPAAEPLRDLVNGYLSLLADPEMEGGSEAERKERFFACLKAALIQADAELDMRKAIRQSYQREEKRAEERLEILETVAREMLDAYGSGSDETLARIHTPIGDLRYQKNSSGSVWVDESRIDEIPEKLGEFELVKVEKRVSKTGIGAWLEYLEEQGQPKPDWAEIKEPGFHLRYS